MPRKIIKQFGSWSVTTTGIWHKEMNYQIDNNQLNDTTWLEHIKAKVWSDYANFYQAWKFAKSQEN